MAKTSKKIEECSSSSDDTETESDHECTDHDLDDNEIIELSTNQNCKSERKSLNGKIKKAKEISPRKTKEIAFSEIKISNLMENYIDSFKTSHASQFPFNLQYEIRNVTSFILKFKF